MVHQERSYMRAAGLARALEKFWANMERTPEGHWLWKGKGRLGSLGYGALKLPLALGFGRKNESAHRLAFYLTRGYWPENARHTCDIPLCCRPEHVIEGTAQDNRHDCIQRGRDRNGTTRLDPESWKAIRESPDTATVLAHRYGITAGWVRKIKRGKVKHDRN